MMRLDVGGERRLRSRFRALPPLRDKSGKIIILVYDR